MKILDRKKINEWFPLFILILILFVVFLPFFYLDFGVHNDYSVFSYENQECCLGYPESQHLFWIGRPLGALLLNVQLLFVDQISDFRWLRLLSFLGTITLFIAIFYQFKKESEDNIMVSALVAFCLILLPSSLLYVYWATNFVPGTLNLLLVTLSYYIVYSSYYTNNLYLSYLKNIFGYFILFLTFFIYPPTSYFFLVFICWRVLMSDQFLDKKWHVRTATELFMIIALSGLYFISLKFIATENFLGYFFNTTYPKPSLGAYSLSISSLPEIYDTTQKYVYSSFQLWFVDWSNIFFIAILFILPAFILTHIWLAVKGDKNEKLLAANKIIVPIFILGVVGAPMIYGGMVPTRTLFVSNAVAALMLFASMFNIFKYIGYTKIGVCILGIISIVALLSASIRISVASFNAHLELEFVRQQLSEATPQSVSQGILIQQPQNNTATVLEGVTGDFSLMATNSSGINGFPRGVLKERGLDYRSIPIQFYSNQNEFGFYIVEHQNTLFKIIRMSELGLGFSNRIADSSMIAISSNVNDMLGYTVLKAFDRSPDSFWETGFKGQPVTLEFNYKRPTKLQSYGFYVGTHGKDSTSRMPTNWKLLASSDGAAWVALDIQNNVEAWTQNETRKFKIGSQQPYQYYKFMFEKTPSSIIRFYEIDLEYKFISNSVANTPDVSSSLQATSEPTLYALEDADVNPASHTVEKAFDKSTNPDDFWEISIEKPIELNLDSQIPTMFTTYKFFAGEMTERMPATWKLLASDNEKDWIILDEQENFTNWSANSFQTFHIQQQQPARYYRFVFEKALHPQIMRIYEIDLIAIQ